SPNVYPLLPCEQTDSVSIGCLAKDFFPTPISLTWNSNVHGDNETFPVQWIESSYSVSSQLTIPATSLSGETFQCKVEHSSTHSTKTVTIRAPRPPPQPPREPPGAPVWTSTPTPALSHPPLDVKPQVEATIVPPSLEDLYLKQNASISCVVSNLKSTQDVKFSWSRDKGSALDATTGPAEKLANGFYRLSSSLKICAEEWNSGERFSCSVSIPELQESITRSIRKVTDTAVKPPTVYVFPPPSDELVLQETATLTCLATGFSPKDILVTWTQQDHPVSSESFSTFGPKAEGDTFTLYSMLKVPVVEWQRGDTFSCIVGHDGIPLTFIQKNLDKSLGKPTMVNVSVVLSDSDVTCY
ncbi:Ig alpha-1 chain C region, partial [Nestor notabilis]